MKEFTSAVEEIEAGADGTPPAERFIEFKLDGRVLHSYPPLEGQMAFMLASLGRGQSTEQRFAAIINIMMSTLRNEDADYLEGRLLSRDPKDRLSIKTIEAIFESLIEEWFARPTQPSSDSAESEPSTGPN